MNESRLIAWLKRVPPTAALLEVRRDTISGPQLIASYRRDELDAAGGAEELLRATQDDCDDLGAARARYELCWLDASGRVLQSKPVVCEPSETIAAATGPTDTVFDRVKTQDPSAHGLTVALMRHLEVRERMYHSGMAVVIRTAMDTLRDQRGENAELRKENQVLRQQLRRTEDKVGDEAAAAEQIARAEAWNKVTDILSEHVLPKLLERLH